MRNKFTFLTLLFILSGYFTVFAQTQFWSDTFEDSGAPSSGSRTPSSTFSCGSPATAYFLRTNVSSINLQSGSYSGYEGSKFWAGEDIDYGGSCTNASQSANQQVTWSGINISGKTGLSFKGLFAANDAFGANWEGSSFAPSQDFIKVEYQIDGGGWLPLVAFYANSTAQSQTLNLETTGDLVGDGTALSYTFQEFSANIPSTGTTLDLRLNVFANGSSTEEIGADNFRLFTTPSVSTPSVTTSSISIFDSSSATMGGNVTADGGATVTEKGVVYSTSDDTPTIAEGATKVPIGSGTGSFSQSVGSLTAGTLYYVNAYATNSAGTSYGAVTSFTTTAAPVEGWTKVTPSAGSLLYCVQYGNNVFITIDYNTGKVYKSTDNTQSWTLKQTVTGKPAFVAYGNSTFVATDNNGREYGFYSTDDGETWSEKQIGSNGSGSFMVGIAYGSSGFAAVSQSNLGGYSSIFKSSDGITWTQEFHELDPSNNTSSLILNAMGYGDGIYVAVGSRGRIFTSPDATNWTWRPMSMDLYLVGVAYGNGIFVAVADNGTVIMSSDGGDTWGSAATYTASAGLYNVGFANGYFYAVGAGGIIIKSSDGVNWTTETSGVTSDLYSFTYGNGYIVVSGDNGVILTKPSAPTSVVPTVTTTAISTFGATSATMGGDVTADGGATVTERGVVYSTSDDTPTIAEGATKVLIGSGTGSFSQSVGSLTAGTLYYVNAYATNSAGTSYGTATSFTTSAAPAIEFTNCPDNIIVDSEPGTCAATVTYPALTTNPISENGSLATSYASNNGSRGAMFDIVATSDIYITRIGANLYGGTTADYEIYYKSGSYIGSETNSAAWTKVGNTVSVYASANNVETEIPIDINLFVAAGEHYAFYVTNTVSGGLNYTSSATGNVTLATNSDLTMTGGVGKAYPFSATYSYRLFNGTIHYSKGSFISRTSGLGSGASFPVGVTTEAYTASDGLGNTANCSFTVTVRGLSTLTTSAASSIDYSSATLGGNISADCGGAITERGVVYSTSDDTPTIAEGATKVAIGSGTGSFSQSVGSLTMGTLYYVNAYATNSAGTSYGTATSFTTLSITLNASSQTNVSCNGGSNGAASVSAATGGTEPYTYNWTPGNPTGDGTTSVTGLTAGTWTCTVTDDNGSTASYSFTITEPTALSLTAASQTNIACNGGANGAAAVNAATGGSGGYTYNWTPGNPTGDGTTSVTGLTAGTWTCTVTDDNGCTATQNFTVTQPTALDASISSYTNVSCGGNADGTATVSVTGGTAPYNYSWSPSGGTAATASGLAAGTYTVTVTDDNGCVTSANIEIIAPQVSVYLYRLGNLFSGFCTIQSAVNASEDGDVIKIDAGTYTEQVTITKGITLQGAGRDLTTIESPEADQLAISGGNWKNMKDQDVFDIIGIKTTNDAPVTIKDLKIDGRDQGFITYPEYAENKGLYDFHGIGAYNTTVTIDNVYVTGIRNLASQFVTNQEDPSSAVPDGYLPTDQPAGINHNDAIFAESGSTAGEHTFTLTNSYITQFQKTAVLVWGPTLTVNIDNNTIQGYGQTLWSTGNGIQVASSDRSGLGGANDDRRGTKGSVTNNQMLGMGIVIPEEGQPGYYFNPGLYSPAGVLLYEAGDDFVISGNTFERSNQTKSWHVDFTSNDGGYGNTAIDIISSIGTVISNNTVDGYDEAIVTEMSSTAPSIIASNNMVLNNTIDYGIFPGSNQITLGSGPEVLTYYHNTVGNNEISNFRSGDKIQVIKLAEGVVNGMLNGNPSIDYTNGTVTGGTGTNVAAYSVQIHYDGTQTSLFIDTDGAANQAELVLKLNGEYSTANFLLNGPFIEYQDAIPAVTTTNVSTFDATSATMGGNVTYDGGTSVTERGIVYSSTNTIPEIGGNGVTKLAIGTGAGSYSQSIGSLSPNTTYNVQAYAINSAGTNYGGIESFTTPKQSQTITFDPLTSKTYGDADFALSATASSGLAVSLTTSDPNVATILGGQIHIVGAGACTVYADQAGNNIFSPATQVSQTLTVNKAMLTVTADAQAKVYGDVNDVLTFQYSGWQNSDNETVLDTKPTASTTVDLLTNVGTHTDAITVSGGADNNYDFTYVPADYEVTKAMLTVTADAQTKVYGDVNDVLTFQYSGWQNSDNETVLDTKPTASTTVDLLTNVGTHTDAITVAGGTDNNYDFTYVPADYEVTKAMLTVTADGQTKVYGDVNDVLTFQYSGWQNSDNETVLDTKPTASTTVDLLTNVGTHTDAITVSGGADNNYDFTYVPADYEVTKAMLTVTADAQTKVYGDVNDVLTFQYSGWQNSDDETVLDTKPTASTTVDLQTNVGTHTDAITVAGGADNNYDFTYVPADYTVTKALLSIWLDSKTKVYGDENPTLTYHYTGFKNADTENALDIKPYPTTTVTKNTNVGVYGGSISMTVGPDKKYNIVVVSGTFTVTKAMLNVIADPQTKSYGDINPTLSYTYNGWKNSDSEVDLDTKPTATTTVDLLTSAGVYSNAITISGGIDNNYDFTYAPADFEVTKSMLTVTADSKSKIFAEVNPELTFLYSGWKNGEDESVLDTKPAVNTLVDLFTPVGIYTNAITVSGAADNNYDFTYVAADFEVNKVMLTVTAESKTKVYGAANPELTFHYNGWKNGEDESVLNTKPVASTLVDISTSAGVHTNAITVSGGIDDNYEFAYVSADFEVTKAMLAVVADSQTKVYGNANPTLTFNYSGWQNGDSESALDTKPTSGTTVDLLTTVGTHSNAITVSGGIDNNYDFTYVPADFEVTKALLSIDAEAQNKVYDGTNNATVTVANLVGVLNGDIVSLSLGSASFENKNVGNDKAVTVTGSSISGAGAGNYTLNEVSGLMANITPKQLTIMNTSVVTNKMFDNATTAVVESVGTLQGVETGDENSIDVSAIASYNDAVAGNDKVITTVFTLSGSAASNYIKPVDLILTGAKISEIVKLSEALEVPVMGECQGEDLFIGYQILKGTPTDYQITFNAAALAAGFVNTGYLPLPSVQNQDKLYINIPANMVEGVYTANLQFRNELNEESPVYPFEFTIKLSKDYIVKKFDDVILCDNSSNRFTAYQWYKNGQPIPGATGQFYNDESGLDGLYSLQVSTKEGAVLWSCDQEIHSPKFKNATISAYPNPAKSSEPFTVKITELNDQDLRGAVMRIYNVLGALVQTINEVKQVNSVKLPFGEYIGTVTTSDQKRFTYKITVVNY